MSLIDDIVRLEWEAFDKVQNEGGRANCQDDFETFSIMRRSQFLTWDVATLASYDVDLERAALSGRNLVQEKYARMMASTAPARHAEFAYLLPPLSAWQRIAISRIVDAQLAWRALFAQDYPRLSRLARSMRSDDDTAAITSFETYLRGELATYSEETLRAYAKMIDDALDEGRNLTTESMTHTARFYGYASLDAAERRLAAKAA